MPHGYSNGKVTPQDLIGEKIEDALTKGNCRRAMGILSQRTLLDPDSQKGIRVTHELHPDPPRDYDPPTLEPSRNHDPIAKITEEEVINAIKSMGLSKSPGLSGLGPAHWRVLIQVPGVPDILVQAFNEILGSPE